MEIQKFEYLESGKSFLDEIKKILKVSERLSFAEKIKNSGHKLYCFLIVGLSSFKKLFLFVLLIILKKLRKNAFYFILKAVFALKVLTFWSCRKSGLMRN